MSEQLFHCPDCGNKAIRERAANVPKNVKRRELGDVRKRFVCDNCEFSADLSQVVEMGLRAASAQMEANAMDARW